MCRVMLVEIPTIGLAAWELALALQGRVQEWPLGSLSSLLYFLWDLNSTSSSPKDPIKGVKRVMAYQG